MFTNFDFEPEKKENKLQYFDDVKSSDGWEGHTTSKTVERIIQEIQNNLALLDCVFVSCEKGKFGERLGFRIHFAMKSKTGEMVSSRLNIACLPLRKKFIRRGTKDNRIEGTQKMALYMTAKAIKGMYFLNVLSPEFIPFMSLILQGNQTLGQLWITRGGLTPLLPSPVDVFDAEVINDK
ncbi:MAG: hypothetical protein IPL32_18025 [Chloracidobacterium sp.]|nr:hypothetical protein [Chloracidobacterium sp.]